MCEPAAPSVAGAAEPTRAAVARLQARCIDQLRCLVVREDELCDAIATRDRDRLDAAVLQNDLDLATIVGVDRPGCVGQRDSMGEGETGPGADLPLDAGRNLEREPRADQSALAWREDEGRLRRGDVVARRAIGSPRWERQVRVVAEAQDENARHARNFAGSSYGSPNASATPGYVIFPLTTFSPFNSAGFWVSACCQPFAASCCAYGNVAFVRASVDVRGTPPGMFATP